LNKKKVSVHKAHVMHIPSGKDCFIDNADQLDEELAAEVCCLDTQDSDLMDCAGPKLTTPSAGKAQTNQYVS
jgi:hypothetical protein